MDRPVSQKMGITAESRVLVLDGPPSAIEAIDLSTAPSLADDGVTDFHHIVVFTRTQLEVASAVERLRPRLAPASKLWIAWPKAGRLGTDLTIKHVIRIGYDGTLVESTNLRIDDDWTALKFTHPKLGKTYRNSYGQLPGSGGSTAQEG